MLKINFNLPLIILFLICSTNVKSQWTKITPPSDTVYFQQLGVSDLIECNEDLFVLPSLGEGLFRSSDGGKNWISLPIGSMPLNLYSDGKILFLNYADGTFFRSIDNGSTWANIDNSFLVYKPLPPPNDITQYATIRSFSFDSTHIFIGTDAGIFCSKNNGTNWIPCNNGLPNDYYNVHITTVTSLLIHYSTLYAGTLYNGIYISTDNGNNWSPLNNGLPPGEVDFPSIQFIQNLESNGTTIFVSVIDSGVYKLPTGSNVWQKANKGILEHTVLSFVKKDSILYAITTRAIYSTNDKGSNWDIVYDGSCFDSGSQVKVIVYNSDFYLGGVSNGIYMSSDDGKTWLSRNNGLGEFQHRFPNQIDAFNSILGISSNDFNIYLSMDEGNSWENSELNDTVINYLASNGSNFFKLFNNYYIKKNENDSWKKISVPYYTIDLILIDTTLISANHYGISYTGYNNPSILDSETTQNWPFSLTELICYTLTTNNNNIYVGTSDGVYLSTNFGKNWEQHGLDNKNVYKLISVGTKMLALTNDGFYRSLDGGNNWNNFNIGLTDIYNIALCNGDLIALTYTDKTIWKNSFNELITDVKKEGILPLSFSLSQNYPNPFNPSTTIGYSIPTNSFVTLKIYNLLGSEIATLVNEEKNYGTYKVIWNAQNIPSGVYFYKITAGEYSEVKKMILLK